MDFEDVFENFSSSNSTFGNFTFDYTIVTEPPLAELIPVSIVYGFTLVLGVVGNVLVIFSVTRYEQMMTTTNTFLLSLASADLLLVIVCVPVKVRPTYFFAVFFRQTVGFANAFVGIVDEDQSPCLSSLIFVDIHCFVFLYQLPLYQSTDFKTNPN